MIFQALLKAPSSFFLFSQPRSDSRVLNYERNQSKAAVVGVYDGSGDLNPLLTLVLVSRKASPAHGGTVAPKNSSSRTVNGLVELSGWIDWGSHPDSAAMSSKTSGHSLKYLFPSFTTWKTEVLSLTRQGTHTDRRRHTEDICALEENLHTMYVVHSY